MINDGIIDHNSDFDVAILLHLPKQIQGGHSVTYLTHTIYNSSKSNTIRFMTFLNHLIDQNFESLISRLNICMNQWRNELCSLPTCTKEGTRSRQISCHKKQHTKTTTPCPIYHQIPYQLSKTTICYAIYNARKHYVISSVWLKRRICYKFSRSIKNLIWRWKFMLLLSILSLCCPHFLNTGSIILYPAPFNCHVATTTESARYHSIPIMWILKILLLLLYQHYP